MEFDLGLFPNTLPVTNRQPVKFKCKQCAACCKNVRNSISLEPLDAYNIIREYRKRGCTDDALDILSRIATVMRVAEGVNFDVFVLNTIDDTGVCCMLKDNRCSINEARPRTCKIYPFTVDPCESERRLKWFICTEQEHHFGEGIVTARDWQRRNVSKEEEEFLYEECRVLSKIGKLLENITEENQKKAAELSLALRYIAYDFDQPFLPQFKNNMDFLQAHLRQLQKR